MKKWLLSLCALLLLFPLALAEDTVTLPDGRALALEVCLAGEQVRGSDCQWEHVFQLDVYDQIDHRLEQRLYFTAVEREPFVKVHDVDMDGWDDLDIIYLSGATNAQHTFFFYDPSQGCFAPRQYGYAWLSNFTLWPEQGVLVNHLHNSAFTGVQEIYRWVDGQLSLVKRGEIDFVPQREDLLVLTISAPDAALGERVILYTQTALLDDEPALRALYDKREELLWEGLEK